MQEDLYNYHSRVFGFPAPGQLFRTDKEPNNDAAYEETLQVQDDHLGYYPDGAKRTLTDDQIAMFRHSEIYSILRARQVRKENLEAERGDESETIASQTEEAVNATALSDLDGEVRSDGQVDEVLTMGPRNIPQYVDVTHVERKRKRGNTDTGYVHGRKQASRSTRGYVRELDSAAAEAHTLDYGDEPSVAEGPNKTEYVATQVAEKDCESQARLAEGRKIWWPIIGAT